LLVRSARSGSSAKLWKIDCRGVTSPIPEFVEANIEQQFTRTAGEKQLGLLRRGKRNRIDMSGRDHARDQ